MNPEIAIKNSYTLFNTISVIIDNYNQIHHLNFFVFFMLSSEETSKSPA